MLPLNPRANCIKGSYVDDSTEWSEFMSETCWTYLLRGTRLRKRPPSQSRSTTPLPLPEFRRSVPSWILSIAINSASMEKISFGMSPCPSPSLSLSLLIFSRLLLLSFHLMSVTAHFGKKRKEKRGRGRTTVVGILGAFLALLCSKRRRSGLTEERKEKRGVPGADF